MNGLQFNLDVDFEYGVTVELDQRLNSGSLILLEPARESMVGIPTQLYNFATETSSDLVAEDMSFIQIHNTIEDVAGGYVERTDKGGIHGIYPQGLTSAPSQRACFSARLPQQLENYIKENDDHAYYMSLIARVTKDTTSEIHAPLAGIFYPASANAGVQANAIYQLSTTKEIAAGTTGANLIGRTASQYHNNTMFIADTAQSSLSLIDSSTLDTSRRDLFTIGSASQNLYKGFPSWIFYSLYIEDLTVSGQTYAQAHQKSQEAFDLRRDIYYDNDNWTTP